jgi:hypothetical protein
MYVIFFRITTVIYKSLLSHYRVLKIVSILHLSSVFIPNVNDSSKSDLNHEVAVQPPDAVTQHLLVDW